MSSFPMAVGQMMVENIPFMHVIANIAIQAQGMGEETFSTVFFIFASSTVFVGLLFYILGHFELGNVIYFVPKHVIVGCIGGIGIFLIVTSIEVSTDVAWEWTSAGVQLFFTPRLLPLWMTSVFFAIILRGLGHVIRNQPMLPPLYFISIPFIVYAVIYITRIPLSVARAQGWFFSEVSTGASPFLMWELIDVSKVNWASVGKSIPTVLALSVFSLMHVPINIPSLSLSTGQQVDMNQELVAHGYSNAISGILGGLPNYLCYSTSVTYFKCNGRGKISGLLLAAITTAFFFLGPSVVTYFPRCMAGCLLFHVGVDLTKEALLDSLEGFDWFEYGSVVAITIVMTTYGEFIAV
jgi:SulP family sulfate permease